MATRAPITRQWGLPPPLCFQLSNNTLKIKSVLFHRGPLKTWLIPEMHKSFGHGRSGCVTCFVSACEEKLREFDSLARIDLCLYKHYIEYKGGNTIRNGCGVTLPMMSEDDQTVSEGIKTLEKVQQSSLIAWAMLPLTIVSRHQLVRSARAAMKLCAQIGNKLTKCDFLSF